MKLSLDRLNTQQREAVLHGDGPLLILAGAGSGKTSTMSYRIAHLISERKIPARQILGLSFTNKAANELRERVTHLVSQVAGFEATQGMWVTTFHSLCVRILREQAHRIGYQRNFTILDTGDQESTMRQILRNIRVDDKKFDPTAMLSRISRLKSQMILPDQAESLILKGGRQGEVLDFDLVLASAYPKYQDQLRLQNAMDFDDLIFQTLTLFRDHSEARDHYAERFRYILVDEYQDTNPSQFELLSHLTHRQRNLCVVGDDDQSIYAWRGADPTHILEFSQHFSGARTITLDQNYRSTSMILDAANHVISKNRNRHPKKLWSDKGEGNPIQHFIVEDDRAEGDLVADEIFSQSKTAHRPWRDFAVLYRSNAQSRIFEESLRSRRIPYKIVGGMSFLERKEIKDALSYWRLIANPLDDASARRVLNWPTRGIGKTSIEALNRYSLENGISFTQALNDVETVAPRAAVGAREFLNTLDELRRQLEATPPQREALGQWAKHSLARLGIRKAIEAENDDINTTLRKWENVEELAHSFGQVKAPTDSMEALREYLSALALDPKEDEDEKDTNRNEVTLLTLHGSKGLEFPVVFLVGAEEGLLPHQRVLDGAEDLSEERRLCYVGITRAKEQLYITRARTRIRWGKAMPRNPSRFLAEIPENLIVTHNASDGPDLSSDAAIEKHEARVKDFLSQIRDKIKDR